MVSEKEIRENIRRREEYRNRLFIRYALFKCSICNKIFRTINGVKYDLMEHFENDPKAYEEIMRGFK